MRTAQLKELMEIVLKSIPKPHAEDVIEDVFFAIEQNPKWRKEYDDLQYNLGKAVVNAWGGFWIAHTEGRVPGEHVSATRSSLIEGYAKLARGPKSTLKKMKEPAALKIMSEYFFANKQTLPASIREHRALLLELIKEGFDPADAFTKVLERPKMAH